MFKKSELKKSKNIEMLTIQETNENAFHFKMKVPKCERYKDYLTAFFELKSHIRKHCERMKLCSKSFLNSLKFQKEFYKVINNNRGLMGYLTKRNVGVNYLDCLYFFNYVNYFSINLFR